MNGKKVLVTGASSGIGFKIAEDFLAQGAIVGVHYRQNKTGAERLVAQAGHDRCKIFQADFRDTSQVTRLWSQFLYWAKSIDILINNAAEAGIPASLSDLTEDVWDIAFQVNVKAPWLLSREALQIMSRQESGRIINISSVGVKFGGGINTVHYSASKAALEALTMSLAKAGAAGNVLVNAIRVGITDTDMHKKIGRTDLSQRVSLVPLGRAAQPKEISQVVSFLASEASSYITGTVITAAGGE